MKSLLRTGSEACRSRDSNRTGRRKHHKGDGGRPIPCWPVLFQRLGADRDNQEALKWFHVAADQRYAPAQNEIGRFYFEGLGVTRDYSEALKFFRMATDQGLAEAQKNVDHLYRDGLGVARDEAEAMRWDRMATEHSHGTAPDHPSVASDSVSASANDQPDAVVAR